MDCEVSQLTYIDLFCEHTEHADITRSTARVLLNYDTTFHVANNSHLKSIVGEQFRGYNVRKTKFYRWFLSSFILIGILCRVKDRKIIFAYCLPIHYIILALFSTIQNNKIHVFLHGELKYVFLPEGLGQIIGGYILKRFGLKSNKIQFIAISFAVYENLKRQKIVKNLSYIEHAIDPVEREAKAEVTTIGSFGTLSADKHSSLIYDLVEIIDKRRMPDVSFITVGSRGFGFEYDQHHLVEHFCRGSVGKDFHEQGQFLRDVTRIDMALLFNDTSREYAWIPSAVIYDCIKLGIPILSIQNETVHSYNGRYGEIGIVFPSLDELAKYFENDILSINKDYHRIRGSMTLVAKFLTLEKFQHELERHLSL